MPTYFRTIAYLMRGTIGLWWAFTIFIPFSWSRADWPPYGKLALFYIGGIFITAILWGATVVILKVAGEK